MKVVWRVKGELLVQGQAGIGWVSCSGEVRQEERDVPIINSSEGEKFPQWVKVPECQVTGLHPAGASAGQECCQHLRHCLRVQGKRKHSQVRAKEKAHLRPEA